MFTFLEVDDAVRLHTQTSIWDHQWIARKHTNPTYVSILEIPKKEHLIANVLFAMNKHSAMNKKRMLK